MRRSCFTTRPCSRCCALAAQADDWHLNAFLVGITRWLWPPLDVTESVGVSAARVLDTVHMHTPSR